VKKQYCDRNAILRGYGGKESSDAEFEANGVDPLRAFTTWANGQARP
jgi:hypothetical protein